MPPCCMDCVEDALSLRDKLDTSAFESPCCNKHRHTSCGLSETSVDPNVLRSYSEVASRFQRQQVRGGRVEVERGEADDALADHAFTAHALATVQAEAHAHLLHVARRHLERECLLKCGVVALLHSRLKLCLFVGKKKHSDLK